MTDGPGGLPNSNPLAPGPVARFLLSGGFNTAVTYGLYLLLLNILSFKTSYTIAYVSGIVLAYGLNRCFVFRTGGGLRALALTSLIYLLQYCAGLAIVTAWVDILGWPAKMAPAAAIAITVPVTYFLSHRAFLPRAR